MSTSNDGTYVSILGSGILPTPDGLPLTLVNAKFADMTAEKQTLLEMMRGTDGTGGYIGALAEAITSAPSATLTATEITSDVADLIFSETALPTDLYDDLLARLQADLVSGATGLTAAIENAIMARAVARQVVINDRQYDKLMAELDGRDFSFPSGALASALVEQAQDALMQETDVNNTILIQSSDLAQKNSQFVIQAANTLEASIRQTNSDFNKRALEYATGALGMLVEGIKVSIENARLKLQAETDTAKLALDAYGTEYGMRIDIAKAIAGVVSQLAASVIGAVTASAGVDYRASESKSEDFNHSDQLSESHQYEEAAPE